MERIGTKPDSCYYRAVFKSMATPSLRQNIELRKRTAWAVIAILVVGAATIYFLRPTTKRLVPKSSQAITSPQALLIERKGVPELSSENNAKVNSIAPEMRELAEAVMNVMKVAGDGKDKAKVQQATVAFSKLIQQHPDYADAYVLRATYSLMASSSDLQGIKGDLDAARRYRSSSKYESAYGSDASIYALRAKVDMLAGDYQRGMQDLESAVKLNPGNPNGIFNTGGVKPDDGSNPTTLQKKDFDILVFSYPNDYRTYMFRGLFYGSFTTFDEQYYAPTFANLSRALEMNPQSALVHYFLGCLFQRMTFWTQAAARDISEVTGVRGGYKEKTHRKALEHFEAAVRLDPRFAQAYAEAAQELLNLHRDADAIPFYDKAIEGEPKDAALYNDRGLAKSDLASYFDAISDFSQAIELKRSGNGGYLESTYENRASAYSKSGDYDRAIEDYSRAIGVKFSQVVFLMSIPQIRAIYPELNDISDPDLLEGLRQKYFPNMSSADFAGQLQKNKPFDDFILAGLYGNRGDVYLSAHKFRQVSAEYNRARQVYTHFTMDRWKVLSKGVSQEYSIDAQTLDFSRGTIVSLWVKSQGARSKNYEQTNYEIDCSGPKIKAASYIRYDSQGNALRSGSEKDWQNIAPETLGELLYWGMCH
jgi:tetratricopeptide (TPR) repeat protein